MFFYYLLYMMSFNVITPAYGEDFLAWVEGTDVFHNTDPNKISLLKRQFGSAYPLLLKYVKTESWEIQPHSEIWHVLKGIIDKNMSIGVANTYLNHGYGTTKLKAKIEVPELYEIINKVMQTVTGRLIDLLQWTWEVYIWLWTVDDWYWENDRLSVNGKNIRSILWSYDFENHWCEYLQWFSHLWSNIGWVVQETAHNAQSLVWLDRAIKKTLWDQDFLVSFYLNKQGYVPDFKGDITLENMAKFCNKTLSSHWRPWLNCITREKWEVWLKILSRLSFLKDKKFWYWPNSSPDSYDWDYTARYKEPLHIHLQHMKQKVPQLTDVTWCCWHAAKELMEIL